MIPLLKCPKCEALTLDAGGTDHVYAGLNFICHECGCVWQVEFILQNDPEEDAE